MKTKSDYDTKGKKEITLFLEKNKEKGVTVQEIKQHMEEIGSNMNLSTIYRTLDKLQEKGFVVKHAGGQGKKATFQVVKHGDTCRNHLHIQCNHCGRVVHLDCSFMEEMQKHIKRYHGFYVDCSASTLHGVCGECSSR